MKLNITTKRLEARPRKKGLEYQDLSLKGFGCRHTSEACGRFFIRYRDEAEIQRRLAIGGYPELSLKEARKLAKKLLKGAKARTKYKDPRQALERIKNPKDKLDLRLNALVPQFLHHLEHEKKRRQSTVYQRAKTFRANILPRLGAIKVTKLEPLDFARMLRKMAKQKPGTANNVRATMSSFIAWCIQHPDIYEAGLKYNWVRDVPRYTELQKRKRILSDDEIRKLFNALPELNGFGAVTETLLRTGLRRNEIVELTWDRVNLEEGHIELLPEHTKTHQHQIQPLTPKVREILEGQPTRHGHVFRNSRNEPFRSHGHYDQILWKRSGIKGAVVHDLRRTCRTSLSRAGVKPHIAEAVLGHVKGGVEGTYDLYAYKEEKHSALTLWDELLDEIVKKKTKDDDDNLETPI